MKSLICFRSDGQPKSAYINQVEAQCSAEYVSQEKGIPFSAYSCKACGDWHICPSERQTPSQPCAFCTGSNGAPKALYESYEGAENRANIILDEQGVSLIVYRCEFQGGFHLTKG